MKNREFTMKACVEFRNSGIFINRNINLKAILIYEKIFWMI